MEVPKLEYETVSASDSQFDAPSLTLAASTYLHTFDLVEGDQSLGHDTTQYRDISASVGLLWPKWPS